LLPAASHAPHASSDVDTTALQAQLADALSRITELETECKEANEVIDYAEEIVEKFKQQIREYANSHQSATIGKDISSLKAMTTTDADSKLYTPTTTRYSKHHATKPSKPNSHTRPGKPP
jgi:chromosome segregation ATPase